MYKLKSLSLQLDWDSDGFKYSTRILQMKIIDSNIGSKMIEISGKHNRSKERRETHAVERIPSLLHSHNITIPTIK